ncbi:hypothetical protein IAU60_003962 [Kwoniella sp. DSM 27419]
MAQPSGRERLDVESPQAREARLGNLLSTISSPNSGSIADPPGSGTTSPLNALPTRPYAVPQSDVLSRVKAFLPALQASNEELLARAAQDPESVNMEKLNGGRAVAMDLGLGVFDAPQDARADLGPMIDTRAPAGLSDDEAEVMDQEASENDDSMEESSESSSDSSDEDEDEDESEASSDRAGQKDTTSA